MKTIKKILFSFLLLLMSYLSYGQTSIWQGNSNTFTGQLGGTGANKWFLLPSDTTVFSNSALRKSGLLASKNGFIYRYDTVSLTWKRLVDEGEVPKYSPEKIINLIDYGAVPDDGVDDTQPIQRAIDSAFATGKKIYAPCCVYNINGAVVDDIGDEWILGQLYIPFGDSTKEKIVEIFGQTAPNMSHTTLYSMIWSDKTTVFKSNNTTGVTGDNVISMAYKKNGTLSRTQLVIRDMSFVVPNHTGISAIRASWGSSIRIENVLIDHDTPLAYSTPPLDLSALHPTNYGIYLPLFSNFQKKGLVTVKNVMIKGFQVGIRAQDQAYLSDIYAIGCFDGIAVGGSISGTLIENLIADNCRNAISGLMHSHNQPDKFQANGVRVIIGEAGKWYSYKSVVNDSMSQVHGFITGCSVDSNFLVRNDKIAVTGSAADVKIDTFAAKFITIPDTLKPWYVTVNDLLSYVAKTDSVISGSGYITPTGFSILNVSDSLHSVLMRGNGTTNNVMIGAFSEPTGINANSNIKLAVFNDAAGANVIRLGSWNNISTTGNLIIANRARGTMISPASALKDDLIFSVQGNIYTGSAFSSSGIMNFRATETGSAANKFELQTIEKGGLTGALRIETDSMGHVYLNPVSRNVLVGCYNCNSLNAKLVVGGTVRADSIFTSINETYSPSFNGSTKVVTQDQFYDKVEGDSLDAITSRGWHSLKPIMIGSYTSPNDVNFSETAGTLALVKESTTGNQLRIGAWNSSNTTGTNIIIHRASGTMSSPLPIRASDLFLGITMSGYDGASFQLAGGVGLRASDTFGPSKRGTVFEIRTVLKGTTAVTSRIESDSTNRVNINPTSGNVAIGTYGANTFNAKLLVSGTVYPTGGIIGVPTADNAPVGIVGEIQTSNISSGAAVVLTSETPANITAITLTAGDWELDYSTYFIMNAANVSEFYSCYNTSSATLADGEGNSNVDNAPVSGLTGTKTFTMSSDNIHLGGSQTFYLVVQSTFSSGTVSAYGKISARRVR